MCQTLAWYMRCVIPSDTGMIGLGLGTWLPSRVAGGLTQHQVLCGTCLACRCMRCVGAARRADDEREADGA